MFITLYEKQYLHIVSLWQFYAIIKWRTTGAICTPMQIAINSYIVGLPCQLGT